MVYSIKQSLKLTNESKMLFFMPCRFIGYCNIGRLHIQGFKVCNVLKIIVLEAVGMPA